MPAGRPTVYDEETVSKLLDLFAGGASIQKLCQRPHMPKAGTVASWVARDYPPGFRARFFEAFTAKMILEADRILPIVDAVKGSTNMAEVQAARSMADMRRWLAGRVLAEFGDRVDHRMTLSGSVQVLLPTNGRLAGDDARLIDGDATELLEEGT
jgi:hypothetical protein